MEGLYPPDLAEEWDAVGLVCGDRADAVRRVLFAVDPLPQVIDEALAWDADLLVTHHPLLLRGVTSVATDSWKGRAIHRLIQSRCALFTAHTNADVASGGVSDALAASLQLRGLSPLRPWPGQPSMGLGRVGELDTGCTLGEFASRVAAAIPPTPGGVRCLGELDGMVRRVAVCGGAGDGLLSDVVAAGVDAFVTADLRHHPASEHLADGGPALIDAGHWASEWPWLPMAAAALTDALKAGGLAATTVETRVSSLATDPVTEWIPSREGQTAERQHN
jgi:dinuclear metal center YbgI/SA1388 family protein